jgi:hypothetical protein
MSEVSQVNQIDSAIHEPMAVGGRNNGVSRNVQYRTMGNFNFRMLGERLLPRVYKRPIYIDEVEFHPELTFFSSNVGTQRRAARSTRLPPGRVRRVRCSKGSAMSISFLLSLIRKHGHYDKGENAPKGHRCQ